MAFTTYMVSEGVYCTTDGEPPPSFISSWPVPDDIAAEIEDGAMLEVSDIGALVIDNYELT